MKQAFVCAIYFVLTAIHGLLAYVTFDGKAVPALPAPSNPINVANVIQLRQALLNQAAGQTIVVAPGTYSVGSYEPLEITVDDFSIRGATDDPADVLFVGQGFDIYHNTSEEMIKLYGDRFVIANLTLSEVGGNCLKIQSGANDNCVVHNVHFLNIGQRMIKGPAVAVSHSWEIRYCKFEDTKIPDPSRGDIAGGNYIAGMDLMMCNGFNIHDNVFLNIKGATGDGRGAVFSWNGSSNMNTFRNTFIGCDKAICYWATVTGGVIKNNMICAGKNLGARIDSSTGIKLYNNTSFSSDSGNGVFTFDGSTNCEVKNNIIYGGVSVLSGSLPDTSHNIIVTRGQKLVVARWFGAMDSGDLHIHSDTCRPVDRGMALAEVTDDWDSLPRDAMPDIGADEYSNNPGVGLSLFGHLPAHEVYLGSPEPNPFNPTTLIRYKIPSFMMGELLRLEIVMLTGTRVATLKTGVAVPGCHAVLWDATDKDGKAIADGVYILRLTVGGIIQTARVTYKK